jgi:hypothetical protein
MTNQALTNEVCRMIRGIALNYPDGMQQIVATVHACTRLPSISSTRTEAATIPGNTEDTETTFAGTSSAQPNDAPTPESDHAHQQTPRKRGRPRKQETQG